MQHQGSQIEWPFRSFSDDALVAALRGCRGARAGRDGGADSTAGRKWIGGGSMATSAIRRPHAYCVEGLHFSESEAFLRITVARLCRRFPVLFGMLERGELHLSGAAKLAPYLTE